jgi:hypothetical protein
MDHRFSPPFYTSQMAKETGEIAHSVEFLLDTVDNETALGPSRFRLRTRGRTSTLIVDWRRPSALDELIRAVLLSISREVARRLLPGTDAELDLGVRPIGWGTR